MNDLVFRKIHGHIIPIRKKISDAVELKNSLTKIKYRKGDIPAGLQAAGGTALAIGSGMASAAMIRRSAFAYGRSATLRGASKLAMSAEAAAPLIRQAAAFKVAGKMFASRGFAILAAGTTIGGAIATYGASKLLKKRVSEEKRATIAGTIGTLASGAGLAIFGSRANLGNLIKIAKNLNPKKPVGDLFSMWSKEGMTKTSNTIKKFNNARYSPKNLPKGTQLNLFGNK